MDSDEEIEEVQPRAVAAGAEADAAAKAAAKAAAEAAAKAAAEAEAEAAAAAAAAAAVEAAEAAAKELEGLAVELGAVEQRLLPMEATVPPPAPPAGAAAAAVFQQPPLALVARVLTRGSVPQVDSGGLVGAEQLRGISAALPTMNGEVEQLEVRPNSRTACRRLPPE
jgi:hypothetical protein